MGEHPRRRAIITIRFDLARISIALATGSSGSSTGSNNVVGLQHATTGLPPTTLPSFNLRQSGYGCALMSTRPCATADAPSGLDHSVIAHLAQIAVGKPEQVAKNLLVLRAKSFTEPADLTRRGGQPRHDIGNG